MTHHDEPRDEGRVSDVPETAVVDVRLHLQVEEEALVDDVGKPARERAEELKTPSVGPQLEADRGMETSPCECAADFRVSVFRQSHRGAF